MDHSHFTRSAEEIAKKAGACLMQFWNKTHRIEAKSSYWDLVTEADTAAEKIILEVLEKDFPTHNILTEETGAITKSDGDYLWLIDPLDGTTNYSHHFPLFAVSIALQYKGEIIAGVIFDPLHQELFSATKDIGASLNETPIQVSSTESLEGSLLATGFAYDRAVNPLNDNYDQFCRLTNISQGVRRLGSAALDLAFVAAGRLDGYWETGLKPWDMAAGSLLVQEAKGAVSSYGNQPFDVFSGRIIATNGVIHSLLNDKI